MDTKESPRRNLRGNPLNEKKQPDLESFERSINRNIDAGVNGLFFLHPGEVAFLTDAWRWSRAAGGRGHREPSRARARRRHRQRPCASSTSASAKGYVCRRARRDRTVLRTCPREVELLSATSARTPTCPVRLRPFRVRVHTKLDPTMLVNLFGKDGAPGREGLSGDDVPFRWLVSKTRTPGHPLQLLTGHEVWQVDGAYLGGADGSVPGLANPIRSHVEQLGVPGRRLDEGQGAAHHPRTPHVPHPRRRRPSASVPAWAFKTALWQMGVFNTNQMREPRPGARGRRRRSHRRGLKKLASWTPTRPFANNVTKRSAAQGLCHRAPRSFSFEPFKEQHGNLPG